jgi:hypothetical protein
MHGPEPADWFVGDGCTCSPDGIGSIDWTEACRWHDWAYRQDTDISRLAADWYLFLNMVACRCPLWLAVRYFVAVRCCGWRFYNRKTCSEGAA